VPESRARNFVRGRTISGARTRRGGSSRRCSRPSADHRNHHANSSYRASLPPVGWGHELHLQALSEGLVRRGERVTVLTSRASSSVEFYRPKREATPLPEREHINGVEVRRLDINHSLRTFLFNTADQIRGWARLRSLLLDQEVMDMLLLGPLTSGMCREIVRVRPDAVLTLNAFYATGYLSYVVKVGAVRSVHDAEEPSNTARRASAGVVNRCRSSSSHSSVARKLSHRRCRRRRPRCPSTAGRPASSAELVRRGRTYRARNVGAAGCTSLR